MSKIRFKKIDETEEKIFVDDNFYLGRIKKNIWTQEWTLHPIFKTPIDYQSQAILTDKYDSFYRAGKAMVRLYNIVFDLGEKEKSDPFKDTDEFDMRGVFKSWAP
tara:strand:- start:27 stop:341 length:315 start_codon:yes stop_codon:yes gene_type:complete